MRVYRHFVVGITGDIQLELLSKRVGEELPDVSIESFKLLDSMEAFRYCGFSSGRLILGEETPDFRMDLLVVGARTLIFETMIEDEEVPEEVLEGDFIKEKVRILADGEETDNPLYMHGWMKLFELLNFPAILPKLADVNMIDERSQRQTHDAIQEISLIDAFYMGEQCYFQTSVQMVEEAVLCGEYGERPSSEESSAPIECTEDVWKQDNVYCCNGDEEVFMDLYRYLLHRRCCYSVLNNTMQDWLISAAEQAEIIRDNLAETNKVYWNRLKRRLEVWDLNYLTLHMKAVSQMNALQDVEMPILKPLFLQQTVDEMAKSRERLRRNMDALRYAIGNLKTPCEAHDEELLQRETEKVNDRIMLLSFLAMSIPLLGAILAPGISAKTKLAAAVILFSLPAVYMYFRRFKRRQGHRKATVDYLSGQRDKIAAEIEETRTSLESIRCAEKLGDATREQTTSFLEKTLATSEKLLRDLDREIQRHS